MAGKKDTAGAAAAAAVTEFEGLIPVAMHPLVAALALATRGTQGFLYIEEKDAQALFNTSQGSLVDVDQNNKNADNQIAVRLNEAGLAYADANPAEPDTNVLGFAGNNSQTAEEEKQRQSTGYKRPENIEVEKGVAVPTISRGRPGQTSYPFDSMEVNDSFHIAATPENKEPAKSVASSVSTANSKYSEIKKDENGNPIMRKRKVRDGKSGSVEKEFPERIAIREFTIRTVGADDPKGPGCRVWRIK